MSLHHDMTETQMCLSGITSETWLDLQLTLSPFVWILAFSQDGCPSRTAEPLALSLLCHVTSMLQTSLKLTNSLTQVSVTLGCVWRE